MLKRLLAATALCVLAAGRSACAWNGTGHEIIALIAWQDLTPQTRQTITRLLNAHPDHDTLLTKATTSADNKPREAFLTAATWPDLVRTPNTPSSKYNHPVWHYVDMPFALGVEQPPMPDEKWDPAKDPANAAQAWQKCAADLTNTKLDDKDRGIALCWIEHLAGDIHQPLHAISLFSDACPPAIRAETCSWCAPATGCRISTHSGTACWAPTNRGTTSASPPSASPPPTRAANSSPSSTASLSTAGWRAAPSAPSRWCIWKAALPYLTRQEVSQDRTRVVPELPAGYMDRAHGTADTCAALAAYRLADRLNDWLGQPPQTQPLQ